MIDFPLTLIIWVRLPEDKEGHFYRIHCETEEILKHTAIIFVRAAVRAGMIVEIREERD